MLKVSKNTIRHKQLDTDYSFAFIYKEVDLKMCRSLSSGSYPLVLVCPVAKIEKRQHHHSYLGGTVFSV